MNILLNGQPLEIEGIDENTTLAELLAVIEEHFSEEELTVVEIIADGEQVAVEDVELQESMNVLKLESLELSVATVENMIHCAVEDSAVAMVHLEELAQNVAEELRVGNVKEAMERYMHVMDGLEWITTVLEALPQSFAALFQESSREIRRESLLKRVAEQMSMLQTAQENEDWVGLADCLEYEFPDVFNETRDFLGEIRAEIIEVEI